MIASEKEEAVKLLGQVHAWWQRKVVSFLGLRVFERMYLGGLVILLAAVAAKSFGAIDAVQQALFWSSLIVLASALTVEGYLRLVRFAETPWMRWLMLPVAIMVGAMALGIAASLVNAGTEQDPDLFPRATTFMTPFAAIPVIGLIATVLLSVSFIGMFVAWAAHLSSSKPARKAGAWLWAARAFGALAVIVFAAPTIELNSSLHKTAERMAGWMAQVLDMHIDRRCAPAKWDRIRRINDELVLRSERTREGIVFRRETCPLGPDTQ